MATKRLAFQSTPGGYVPPVPAARKIGSAHGHIRTAKRPARGHPASIAQTGSATSYTDAAAAPAMPTAAPAATANPYGFGGGAGADAMTAAAPSAASGGKSSGGRVNPKVLLIGGGVLLAGLLIFRR